MQFEPGPRTRRVPGGTMTLGCLSISVRPVALGAMLDEGNTRPGRARQSSQETPWWRPVPGGDSVVSAPEGGPPGILRTPGRPVEATRQWGMYHVVERMASAFFSANDSGHLRCMWYGTTGSSVICPRAGWVRPFMHRPCHDSVCNIVRSMPTVTMRNNMGSLPVL